MRSGARPSAWPERSALSECPGHQRVTVVEARGQAVHGADEGALPAADHPETDARLEDGSGGGCGVGHGVRIVDVGPVGGSGTITQSCLNITGAREVGEAY
jgi:hypothetical protein